MKRTPLVAISTLAGVAGVLLFNPSGPNLTAAGKGVAPKSTTTGTTQPITGTPATTTSSGTKTATGQAVDARYGYVQVQVTVAGGKITGITALQLPNSDGRSMQISQAVEPMLLQQAMQAQSAKISGISGATYTSMGYAQSLQSALDQLGL
ncbi:MAG: FMN-binding protein [Actinomycetes bacterium]